MNFWKKFVNFQNSLFLSKIHIFLIPLCRRHFRNISKDLSMEFWWKSTFVVLVWFCQNFMIWAFFCSLWGPYFWICGSGKQTKSPNFFFTIFSWTWKCLFIPQVIYKNEKNLIFLQKKVACFWDPKACHKYIHITHPFKTTE